MPTTVLPRPQLGDHMERQNLNGRHEEAVVISIINNSEDGSYWQAIMFTKNGTEFVSSDKEHRGVHDWRPKGWVFDKQDHCWTPPGHRWDSTKNRFVQVRKSKAAKASSAEAAATA